MQNPLSHTPISAAVGCTGGNTSYIIGCLFCYDPVTHTPCIMCWLRRCAVGRSVANLKPIILQHPNGLTCLSTAADLPATLFTTQPRDAKCGVCRLSKHTTHPLAQTLPLGMPPLMLRHKHPPGVHTPVLPAGPCMAGPLLPFCGRPAAAHVPWGSLQYCWTGGRLVQPSACRSLACCVRLP